MHIIFFSALLMINHIGSLAQIPSEQPTSTPIVFSSNANSIDFNLLNTPNAVIALSIVGGIIGLACLWLLICFIRRQPRKVMKLSEKENVPGLYSGDYNEQQWNNQQHGPMKATDNIAHPIVTPLTLPISNNNEQWDGLTMSESEGGPSVFVTQTLPSGHNTNSSSSKKSNQNIKIYRIDADYENQRYSERPSSYTNSGAGASRASSRLPSDYRPSEKFPFSEENVFVFENLMHTNNNSINPSFACVDRSTISVSPRASMSSSRQSMMNPLRRDPPSFRASSAHPAYREIKRAGRMRSSLEGSMMNRGTSNVSNRRDRDSSDNSLSLRWSESFHSRAENSIANSSGRPRKNEFAYDPEIERRLDQENNNANANSSINRYNDSGNQTSVVPSPRFKPPPPTQSSHSQQQQQQKSQPQSSPRQVVNANDRDIQQVPTRGQVMSLDTPPLSSYQQNSPRQPSQSQYDQQLQFSPRQQQLQYEQQQVQYEQQYPPQQLLPRQHYLSYEQQYPPQQPQFSPRHDQSQYAEQYHPQQQRYDQPQQQQYYQEPPQPQQQYYVQQPPPVQSSSRFQSPSSVSPSSSPRYQPPPPIRTQQSQQKQSSSSRYSSRFYNNGNSDIANNMNNANNAATATAIMEMTNSSRTSFPSPRSRMSYNCQPSPLQQQPQQPSQQTSMRSPATTNPHYNDNSDSDDNDDQLSYAESMLSHHPAIKRQSELYQSRSLAAAISALGANSPRR